jgi:MoaA/NifB/PqqE/SkfB family radical SAM enzyme
MHSEVPRHPTKLSIEITNRCNLDCVACCHNATVPALVARDMDWSLFESTLPLISLAEEVLLFGYGEPLMHPRIGEMITAIRRISRAKITINTNGTLLARSRRAALIHAGIHTLVVSLDGSTQATFGSLRDGASFEGVCESVRALSSEARTEACTLRVGVEFVAMHSNIHELPALIRTARAIGASFVRVSYLVAKSVRIEPESLYFHQELADRVFEEGARTAQTIGVDLLLPYTFAGAKVSTHARPTCLEPWTNMYIGCTGEVYVCCVAGRFYRAGNLRSTPWAEIWSGSVYTEARDVLSSALLRGPCRFCFFASPRAVLNREAHIRTLQEVERRQMALTPKELPGEHYGNIIGNSRNSHI